MSGRSYTKNGSPSRMAMVSEQDYESCATRLKALADPDRLRIVNVLLRGEKTVSDLADELNASIVKVSHHLGVLKSAEIVDARKQGKFVIYSLCPNVKFRDQQETDIKTIDLGCCQLALVQPSPEQPNLLPKRAANRIRS